MERHDALRELLILQSGVINRRQVLAARLTDNDIRRMRRRRELAQVHVGVYVDHTGPLSWLQRAWAAVLLCEPAALCLDSAVRAADGPGRRDHDDGRPIHVAVEANRSPETPASVIPHRLADLDGKVLWHTSPPRQRIEHASVDLASLAAREIDAVAHLADAVRTRRTTADRLAEALASRTRIARRDFLAAVIADVAAGTCSTLERGYLDRVERPHGLPCADRQVRESIKGALYRDVVYVALGGIVELDGRLFHTSVLGRDQDLERDLDAVVLDRVTARLGWGQVFDRSCSTAHKVGAALNRLGWTGRVRRCPACPPDLPAVLTCRPIPVT